MFLVYCVARAVDEQREMQGFRRGRRVIVCDQVDVDTQVEVRAGRGVVPVPYVVRDAADKPVGEIHHENPLDPR